MYPIPASSTSPEFSELKQSDPGPCTLSIRPQTPPNIQWRIKLHIPMSETTTPKVQRVPIKRTKTYEGCWTCRARRVKCDRGRPICQRCMKAKFACEGYGIRLSWGSISSDEKTTRVEKKRIRFHDADMLNPVYSEQAIESALKLLDLDPVSSFGRIAGPYTVFPVKACDQRTVSILDNPDIITLRTPSASCLASLHIHNTYEDLDRYIFN